MPTKFAFVTINTLMMEPHLWNDGHGYAGMAEVRELDAMLKLMEAHHSDPDLISKVRTTLRLFAETVLFRHGQDDIVPKAYYETVEEHTAKLLPSTSLRFLEGACNAADVKYDHMEPLFNKLLLAA